MAGRPKLSNEQRQCIVEWLMQQSAVRVERDTRIKDAAVKFGVSRRTIARIWATTRQQINAGIPINVSSKLKGKVGRKPLQFNKEAVMAVPFSRRITIRSLAVAINMNKSSLHRFIQRGVLRGHSNAIKPALTDHTVFSKLNWSLSKLAFDSSTITASFKDMHHVVHIDEKWFYLTRSKVNYYLLPEEREPVRTANSKEHIDKIMFLCAVSRPIFGADGEVIFDGKIGMFPLTMETPAKKKSKYRPRGTMLTKPIPKITRKISREFMINHIIPAIKSKWPANYSKRIVIQQDNAPAHIKPDDKEFMAIASLDGFEIYINCQPPKSPDLNILDLGFFRAIQSLQIQKAAYSVNSLIQVVRDAYDSMEAGTLNKVFLTLQNCMIEIMKTKGRNDYKLPHMLLPLNLNVDIDLVKDAIEFLILNQRTEGLEELMVAMGYNQDDTNAGIIDWTATSSSSGVV